MTTTTNSKPRKLGRGAVRIYQFLLNEGGWWSALELCEPLGARRAEHLNLKLLELQLRCHIQRRGSGARNSPYVYGVTAACTPVPGVEPEVA